QPGHVETRLDIPQFVTTQAFDWPGLRLEAGRNNITRVDDFVGQHHYVSMNLDEKPLTLEVKGPHGFRNVVLRRDSAWVCPAGDPRCRLRTPCRASTWRIIDCGEAPRAGDDIRAARCESDGRCSGARSWSVAGALRPRLSRNHRAAASPIHAYPATRAGASSARGAECGAVRRRTAHRLR